SEVKRSRACRHRCSLRAKADRLTLSVSTALIVGFDELSNYFLPRASSKVSENKPADPNMVSALSRRRHRQGFLEEAKCKKWQAPEVQVITVCADRNIHLLLNLDVPRNGE